MKRSKKKRARSGPKGGAHGRGDRRFEGGMPAPRDFVEHQPRFDGGEERNRYLRETGETAVKNFDKLLPELVAAVERANPVHLLSVVAMGWAYTPARVGSEFEPGAFLQAHYEIIHALTLRSPRQTDRESILSGSEMKRVQDLTVLASSAFHLRRLGDLADAEGVAESRRLYLIEQARASTHVTRNWAYPHQMLRITRELFAPLDRYFAEKWGVTATGLIDMLLHVIALIERRVNASRARLRPAIQARSPEGMARRFIESFPGAGSAAELAMLIKPMPVELARRELVNYASVGFYENFTLTLDDWLAGYPAEEPARARVAAVLDQWSVSFGDLADLKPEHVFLGNPVWRRPVIRLDGDHYFVPHAGLLSTFMFDLLKGLVESDKPLIKRYEQRRAEFLEDAVADLFARAFPDAPAWRGSMWRDESGGQGENDLLVVVDRVALIVEAKSGHFRPKARRGGGESLKDDLIKLRAEPALQAARFAELLRTRGPRLTLRTKAGPPNEIDVSEVTLFVPLSVVLDQLGPMATQWMTLRTAGYVTEEAPFAPTMTLGELEVIFHTLLRTTEKLHYLARRVAMEQRVNYYADEMDLLAFYLQTGFNIGPDELNPGLVLNLNGFSNESIDPYYGRRSIDASLPRPRRRMTRWWGELLDRVEAQRPQMWSLLGIELLNAGEAEQQELERQLTRIRKDLRRGGLTPGCEPMGVLRDDPAHQRAAVAVIAYRSSDQDQRGRLITAAAAAAAAASASDHAVVIGVDADTPRKPCNVVSYHVVDRVKEVGSVGAPVQRGAAEGSE